MAAGCAQADLAAAEHAPDRTSHARTDMVRRMRLVGIYDADGTLAGELRYALSKLAGRSSCALCDITHGWNPMGSRQWRQACAASSVELELVHRDDATPEQLGAATALPSIVGARGHGWEEALTAAEIATFKGAPEGLLARLAAV